MERFFLSIFQFFTNRRLARNLVFLGLMGLFLVLATRLRFDEDISSILPSDERTKSSLTLFRESRFADKIVVAISHSDTAAIPAPDGLVDAGAAFTEAVQQKMSPWVQKVQFRVDDSLAASLPAMVTDHLPVFLDSTDYVRLDSMITREGVRQSLRKNLNILQKPSGFLLKDIIARDPSGTSFLALSKLSKLQADEDYTLYEGSVMSRDMKTLLLFITPVHPAGNTGENVHLVRGLDSIVQALPLSHPGRRADYIGAPAVAVGNALQLRKDSLLSISVTIIFLVLFLALTFRNVIAPVQVLIPVVFGGAFSLAMLYLLQGSVSMIAVAAGSVIMGIAVNYSIHIYNHYRHSGDAAEVVRSLARPLTLGSLTTIGGFFCLRYAELDMLKDLGLFAGLSLIGAAICSLVFLPHFIARPGGLSGGGGWVPRQIDRLARLKSRSGPWFLLLVTGLTVFFFYHARRVQFEADMNSLNFMPESLAEAEVRLSRVSDYGMRSVYLMSEGKTMQQALAASERLAPKLDALKGAGQLIKYQGVSGILQSDSLQQVKIRDWTRYWTPERKFGYLSLLREEGVRMGFSPQAFDAFDSLLSHPPRKLGTEAISEWRDQYLDDYLSIKPDGAFVMTVVRLGPGQRDGFYAAVQGMESTRVFDKQMLTNRFMAMVRQDFNRIALLTSILVFVALWIMYGRIELALISYIPMAVSWIWILGIMSITGLSFNIVNIIISALIFGLGDDYSIYVVNGLLEEYKTGKKTLQLHRSSIIISAITTLAGLGVLLLSAHPALRSISVMSMVGIFCVVLISQFLIPYLFRVLISGRAAAGRLPFTFFSLLVSLFAFAYFVLGSILLWFIGFILVYLNPFGRGKSKYFFHRLLSAMVASLVYVMANVRKRVVRPADEDFSRPAVVIANHQSFLDILLMVMLHPRLVLLTNDWVWNSPVFGFIVRMADYYPVSMGAEHGLERMRAIVEQGYSIVVFPEGTRSVDGTIRRFHKGAFYLAEKLGLDILPIVIHGTGYTMTKGDFLLKNGAMSLRFLPRIRPDDTSFGAGYAERAREIGRYFRQAYASVRTEVETPGYFRQQLIANYLYKGPVLEWYLRVKLRLEGDYSLYHAHLPTRGRILDAGCGYGYVTYMMHFASPERTIRGIDYDEDKITLASHCFSRNAMISFEQADLGTYPLDSYDGILMLDVMHYLPASSQEAIIGRFLKAIRPGGVMIIKEGDSDAGESHRKTRMTEFFSTRVFEFNKMAEEGLSFPNHSFLQKLARDNGMDIEALTASKFTSNRVYLIRHAHQDGAKSK